MSRRVITIVGATGFIGRHLVQRVARAGWIVRAVTRDAENAHFLRPLGEVGQIVPWAGDFRDADQMRAAVDGADAVVTSVGILYESGKRTFQAMHVDGPDNVAEAAAAAGVRTLVHVSAIGSDPYSRSVYGRTKALGEARVLKAFPTATILRPSVVFGPEDSFFNLFASMSRFLPLLPVFGCPPLPRVRLSGDSLVDIDLYGDGGTRFQPVYVGDVADAIIAALERPEARGATYELGGPSVYSFKELMQLMCRHTGRKRGLLPVPFWLAEIQGMVFGLLPKPLLTGDQVTLMRKDNVVGGELSTLADLGVAATSAESILPTYLHHFRTPTAREAEKAASS